MVEKNQIKLLPFSSATVSASSVAGSSMDNVLSVLISAGSLMGTCLGNLMEVLHLAVDFLGTLSE